MKKLLPILFFSISLFGCSSLELEAISSSEEETQRILALGLSHEENLLEASKLSSSHMVSVVTLQLNNAREEKIQNEIDFVESEKFAEMVSISEDNLNFMGPEIVNSIKKGVLQTDIDVQTHFLSGKKSEDGKDLLINYLKSGSTMFPFILSHPSSSDLNSSGCFLFKLLVSEGSLARSYISHFWGDCLTIFISPIRNAVL